MPIPASQIVQVNPRIISAGANNLEFNGLLLSKNGSIPAGTVLQFTEPGGVNDYFGAESEEAQLASVYFLGCDNSFIKPRKLFIARFIDNNAPAYLRGAKLTATLEEIRAVSGGLMNIFFGGKEASLSGLDFSENTGFSEVAQTLQTALQASSEDPEISGATVEYSSLTGGFILTAGTAGSASTVTFATGDTAEILSLTEDAGAVLSQGSDAQTPNECMESILDVTQNWVNFTTVFTATEDEALGFVEWANSKGVDYLFIYADSDPKLLQPGNKNTIAAKIKEQNLGAVAGCYSDQRYAVFLMAIGASIDWNRNRAIVTTAFKAQSGLPANVTNAADAGNLISQGMNFIGDYATRNDNFVFQYPGQMFGSYGWIDAYWGAVWIKNQIQASCMNGFKNAGRLPYNDSGYSYVRAWIQDPINRALNNGVIDTGIVLSETQKIQVNQEVGKDVAAGIESSGYFLEVKDPGANARVGRESPQINFYYTYGGSINKLDIPATMLN